jgi:hypothetical protein
MPLEEVPHCGHTGPVALLAEEALGELFEHLGLALGDPLLKVRELPIEAFNLGQLVAS